MAAVSNSTLDPQLAAVLDSKVDITTINPPGWSTKEILDNTYGTCVLETSGIDIWAAHSSDAVVLQIGLPNGAERIQIAKHPDTGDLIYRINDGTTAETWTAWIVLAITGQTLQA